MVEAEQDASASRARRGGADGPKVDEVWQGNEIFCCNGRLMFGPNWKNLVVSVFLVLVPSVFFCVFVLPPLSSTYSVAFLIVGVCLCAFSLFCLLRTATMDPGIVPRRPRPQDSHGKIKHSKTVTVNGHAVVLRWNHTANLYQPPRAHHCAINDNCIEKFDHHCPWVGTTIGRRNYKWFLLFVWSTLALCVYVLVCSALSLKVAHDDLEEENKSTSFDRILARQPTAFVLIVFCFLMMWFLGGLTLFHCFLVSTNQTTYENIRRSRKEANPYDRGFWRNWGEVMCTLAPPSKVSFRERALPAPEPRSKKDPRSVKPSAVRDLEAGVGN